MNDNFCRNCGKRLEPGARFCSGCGCTVSPDFTYGAYQAPYYRQDYRERKINVGLLIFSIINMLIGGFVFGLIALIMVIGAKDEETDEGEAEKLRIAKILNIISVVFIAVSVVISLLSVFGIMALIFSIPLFAL